MRRTAILAAAVGGLMASTSFGAFIFTVVPTPTANGKTRLDVFARNDGAEVVGAIPAGTTKVQAIQFSDETIVGGTFSFRFTSGSVDLFNNRGGPYEDEEGNPTIANNTTSLYLATGPLDNTYQGISFTPTPTSVATAALVTKFTADIAATSNPPSATSADNAGRGAKVGSLVVTNGASGTVTGNIAAEAGIAIPYSFTFGAPPPDNTPPVVGPAAATVVFGAVVSNGAPFSATVTVTDAQAGLLTLAAGTLPAGVTNVQITPAGGAASPAVFTVTGTVAYAPFGTIVNIPLVATDAGSPALTGNGTLVLTLTPEPASLAALGGAAVMGLIRRRK